MSTLRCPLLLFIDIFFAFFYFYSTVFKVWNTSFVSTYSYLLAIIHFLYLLYTKIQNKTKTPKIPGLFLISCYLEKYLLYLTNERWFINNVIIGNHFGENLLVYMTFFLTYITLKISRTQCTVKDFEEEKGDLQE